MEGRNGVLVGGIIVSSYRINVHFIEEVKKSGFDHEAGLNVYSTANIEFSRVFRCSRTNYVRCAPQTLASFNFLGVESPALRNLLPGKSRSPARISKHDLRFVWILIIKS